VSEVRDELQPVQLKNIDNLSQQNKKTKNKTKIKHMVIVRDADLVKKTFL